MVKSRLSGKYKRVSLISTVITQGSKESAVTFEKALKAARTSYEILNTFENRIHIMTVYLCAGLIIRLIITAEAVSFY